MDSAYMLAAEKIEQNKTEKYITEHYVFHYRAGSQAEKDIEKIAQTQESCFEKICSTLEVQYPERIDYYFSDSPKEVGGIFGDGVSCNGCAFCGENKIFAVYSEEIRCIGAHEDTHLISYLIGYPQWDFLVEGLAMFFDGKWWGVSNEIWTAYYKAKYSDLSVQALLNNDVFDEYGCAVTYPVAGAFTGFLIDAYGIKKYISLYQYDGDEIEEVLHCVYGVSLADLEKSFWEKMGKIAFEALTLEEMLEKEGF